MLEKRQSLAPADPCWRSITYSGDTAEDGDDGAAGEARYTSTTKLLTEDLKENPELVWAAK